LTFCDILPKYCSYGWIAGTGPAGSKIRQLPPTGATPDDVGRVAEDMVESINSNPGADSFREEVLNALGENIN